MKPLPTLTSFALPLLASAASSSEAAPTPSTTSLPPPTAALDSGPIVGVATQLPNAPFTVNKFLGIPYAAKPARFAKPETVEPWTEVRNATEFGAACRQLFVSNELAPGKDILQDFFNNMPEESEDCLFINGFAPAEPGPPTGRPVVLFIHGGGWQQGNGQIDLSGFAGYEEIVAFSFNYRTNIFGFPNSPYIPLQDINVGLYDQQMAIAWAQANAAAFGGDPRKVTIWGESAGSLSVDIHVNAYGDADPPPFRGAMMFSGQMSVGLLGSTASPADTTFWNTTAQVLNCTDGEGQLECMRGVPADMLIEAMSTAQAAFLPVTDNVTLPSRREERWREGQNVRVPVLMGTIAQEGRALVNREVNLTIFENAYLMEPLVTKEQKEAIMDTYKDMPGLETDFDIAAAIYTDFFWQCPQAILANISSSHNPTWRYYFNTSITPLIGSNLTWLEKFHGSDVALLFSTPTFEGDSGGLLTPQLYTFANFLRGVVGRFVKYPNGGPGWPQVGGVYGRFDVANLGEVGDEADVAGVTMVDERELDERCGLYKDIYPLVEEYVINV